MTRLFIVLLGVLFCGYANAAVTEIICPGCENLGCSAANVIQCSTSCASCYQGGTIIVDPIVPGGGVVFDACATNTTAATCVRKFPSCEWDSTTASCVTNTCTTSDDCNLPKKFASEVTDNPGLYSLTYDYSCDMETGTCVSTAQTWYACGGGYHANGAPVNAGTECSMCPPDNTTGYSGTVTSVTPAGLVSIEGDSEGLQGAADVTGCYFVPSGEQTDENGNTFYFEEVCTYVESDS